MVSDKYRCIFVHVPKVAGQSIEQFFLDLHGLTWEQRSGLLLRHNTDRAIGPVRLAHLLASEYVDCGHVSRDTFERYFKFSFVRNPWSRLVSEYACRREYRKIPFKRWVMRDFPEPDMYTDTYRHVIPQCDYLYDSDGKLLVDFVGKFENLRQDFKIVCDRLGIDHSDLPHRNATAEQKSGFGQWLRKLLSPPPPKNVPYTEYYDDELSILLHNNSMLM